MGVDYGNYRGFGRGKDTPDDTVKNDKSHQERPKGFDETAHHLTDTAAFVFRIVFPFGYEIGRKQKPKT